MSLYEQLKSLSAVAHLAHTFFTHHNACSAFIPSPLYCDIQIMVKNAFFCVAKTKHDNLNGEFFLILLGTDCLESIFGLIRSQNGSDVNVSTYSLSSWCKRLNSELEAQTALHLSVSKGVIERKMESWSSATSSSNDNSRPGPMAQAVHTGMKYVLFT